MGGCPCSRPTIKSNVMSRKHIVSATSNRATSRCRYAKPPFSISTKAVFISKSQSENDMTKYYKHFDSIMEHCFVRLNRKLITVQYTHSHSTDNRNVLNALNSHALGSANRWTNSGMAAEWDVNNFLYFFEKDKENSLIFRARSTVLKSWKQALKATDKSFPAERVNSFRGRIKCRTLIEPQCIVVCSIVTATVNRILNIETMIITLVNIADLKNWISLMKHAVSVVLSEQTNSLKCLLKLILLDKNTRNGVGSIDKSLFHRRCTQNGGRN